MISQVIIKKVLSLNVLFLRSIIIGIMNTFFSYNVFLGGIVKKLFEYCKSKIITRCLTSYLS